MPEDAAHRPGLYFEEFEVGQHFRHRLSRTVTEMDNVLFTSLTQNTAPIHLDAEFAKSTIFGKPIVNSLFTLGLIAGQSVYDTVWGTSLGNLGYDKVEFPRPVFHGDTIRTETTIIDKRESRSRPDAGIVWFEHRAFNQSDELVAVARRAGLVLKRPST